MEKRLALKGYLPGDLNVSGGSRIGKREPSEKGSPNKNAMLLTSRREFNRRKAAP